MNVRWLGVPALPIARLHDTGCCRCSRGSADDQHQRRGRKLPFVEGPVPALRCGDGIGEFSPISIASPPRPPPARSTLRRPPGPGSAVRRAEVSLPRVHPEPRCGDPRRSTACRSCQLLGCARVTTGTVYEQRRGLTRSRWSEPGCSTWNILRRAVLLLSIGRTTGRDGSRAGPGGPFWRAAARERRDTRYTVVSALYAPPRGCSGGDVGRRPRNAGKLSPRRPRCPAHPGSCRGPRRSRS